MVAFGSAGAAPVTSGVPSSKQKFRERSVYVRLQVGQRFILCVEKSSQRAEQKSLVIYHLTFFICHFRYLNAFFGYVFSANKMTNEKCQMIYDQ